MTKEEMEAQNKLYDQNVNNFIEKIKNYFLAARLEEQLELAGCINLYCDEYGYPKCLQALEQEFMDNLEYTRINNKVKE